MIYSGGCRNQEDLQRGEACVLGPEQGLRGNKKAAGTGGPGASDAGDRRCLHRTAQVTASWLLGGNLLGTAGKLCLTPRDVSLQSNLVLRGFLQWLDFCIWTRNGFLE